MALTSDLHGRGAVKPMRSRLLAATGLVALGFFGLVWRLYTLQILRGEELASKGEKNFVQEVRVPHDRGIIYDRHGRIIVDNRPSLDVQVIPAFLGKAAEVAATLRALATRIDLDEAELARAIEQVTKQRGLDRFQPIIVKRDLSPDQVEAVETDRAVFLLDGVDIVEGRRRTYRYGKLAAHLLGYTNEIDPDSLKAVRARGNPKKYQLGDIIGRAGVERTYEDELRGADGYEKIVVDAKGRKKQDEYVEQLLGKERRVEPEPGHNVYLSIDLDLQQRVEASFPGRSGAVVVMEPRTGAVLAYVSIPAFDPNVVSGVLAKEDKEKYDTDELKPWLNRPIQGQYAPGSTFKVITALAALSERATSPREKVFCPGYFRMGRQTWRCHKDTGHGHVDLHDAIKLSCDTYFYTMAARVGIDPIAKMARALGYGQKSGIPLLDEKTGIVPDEAFHNRVDAKTGGYTRGFSVNTAIGQGALLTTPLQQALVYAAIANGGSVWKPQIVDRIESADFRKRRRYLPQVDSWMGQRADLLEGSPLSEEGWRSVDALATLVREEVHGEPPQLLTPFTAVATRMVTMPTADLHELRAGLVAVVAEPGGTAYWRRSRQTTMAGKTGTAQVVRLGRDRLKPEEITYFERDHAWFVAYAPAEEPEIVVSVLNEHSGHGGSEAAPIAVSVIDAYFELKNIRAMRGELVASQGEQR
jgi:penicillin-binding protein 2